VAGARRKPAQQVPVNTAIFDFDPASGGAIPIDLAIHQRQRRRAQSEFVDALEPGLKKSPPKPRLNRRRLSSHRFVVGEQGRGGTADTDVGFGRPELR
jgi:hypothetical protein